MLLHCRAGFAEEVQPPAHLSGFFVVLIFQNILDLLFTASSFLLSALAASERCCGLHELNHGDTALERKAHAATHLTTPLLSGPSAVFGTCSMHRSLVRYSLLKPSDPMQEERGCSAISLLRIFQMVALSCPRSHYLTHGSGL